MPVHAHFSAHIKQGYPIPWVPGIDCQLLLESRVLICAQIWQCMLNKSCAKATNDFFEERNMPNSPYFEGKFLVIAIFRHYYITWDHKKQSRILKIYYITIWPIAKFRAFLLWIHRTLKKILLAKFCSFNLWIGRILKIILIYYLIFSQFGSFPPLVDARESTYPHKIVQIKYKIVFKF